MTVSTTPPPLKMSSLQAIRQVRQDPSRHRFHTHMALALTVASLVLLSVLSIVFGEPSHAYSEVDESSTARWLEDNNNNGGDDDDATDYSQYSCRYIYNQTPNPGYGQCRFARTCNDGSGVWAPFVFCHYDKVRTVTLFAIMSPIMITWMVILFRLLGSTAEDYFSPSLEMFSTKMGLPPRFAGVSLLALGNGAADVSATMSAIVNDPENGYKLSLGALSGAAMMVGGVIAGLVVITAGGVPCRGALVRDVTALAVTVAVVWFNISKGTIGPSATSMFLSMYGLFVCLVLVADVYHRAVVLPRIEAARAAADSEQPSITVQDNPAAHPGAPGRLTRVITAISNYDNPPSAAPDGTTTEGAPADGVWGVATAPSSDSNQPVNLDPPIILHGQHGILHGDGSGGLSSAPSDVSSPAQDPGGVYTLIEEHIDQVCVAPGALGVPAANWGGAFHDVKTEIIQHGSKIWEDVFFNGDLKFYEKPIYILELPFTYLRQATIPIPCEGYYNRGFIALGLALSPFWFAYYMLGHNVNLLAGANIVFFLIAWGIAIFAALLVVRFAPGGEGHMPMGVATPIALYGFIIAATWIDWVADNLVGLLDFVGIVLHIPGAIMGLTVLAWGNSMADLSANITMARKGLANMAMTACFAGPVFNILIGLGLGFSTLAARTGQAEATVSLSTPVLTGFIFVLLNCLSILITGLIIARGRIETYYGYIALGMYTIYVVTSISLQFSKYGDN